MRRTFLFAIVLLLGIGSGTAGKAAAATVGCGRVTTFVAPNSSGALNSGDGWLIFAKPDGTSEKVILRSGTLTPSGGVSGYVCIAIDGLYFSGLLAPGTTGYIPEPANWVTGSGVYCGAVGADPFTSGQLSGPRTFQLRGTPSLGGGGIFRVPAAIALPAISSYLCGRFELGGPSQLLAVLQAGDPGYVAPGLPNTSTTDDAAAPATKLAGFIVLIAGVLLLARRTNGNRD